MLRTLFTTTALVVMVSGSAVAAEAGKMPDSTSASSGAPAGGTAANRTSTSVHEFELRTISSDAVSGILATNMVGKPVMTGETGETGETVEIGHINDVVFGQDGEVHAVVVGVGGFLGMGEKEVALDFSRLSFVPGEEDGLTIVSDVSRAELEEAAAYERPDYIPDWVSTSDFRQGMNQVSEGMQRVEDTAQAVIDRTGKAGSEIIPQAGETVDDLMRQDDGARSETVKVEISTVSTGDLIGASIYTEENSDIGEISEVLFGESGRAQAVIVDIGGFLGFNKKSVAVPYDRLEMFENDNGDLLVTADFTREQLENAEPYDAEAYRTDPGSVLLQG